MRSLTSILIITVLLTACQSQLEQGGGKGFVDKGQGKLTCGEIGFETINHRILSTACFDCHKNWAGDYLQVKARQAKIIEYVSNNRMPEPPNAPLTASEKALLFQWFNDGAPALECVKPEPPSPKPEPTPTPTPVPDVGPVGYDLLYKKVIEPKCVECHQFAGHAEDYDFSSYSSMTALTDIFNLADPEQSKIVIATRKEGRGQMPPPRSNIPRLTPEEDAMLVAWIRGGLQKETPVPTPTPTPPPVPKVGYEELRTRVLEPKCMTCHKPGARAEKLDFTTIEAIKKLTDLFNLADPEKSLIVESTRREAKGLMPPTRSNIPRLTPEEDALLVQWIRGGLSL